MSKSAPVPVSNTKIRLVSIPATNRCSELQKAFLVLGYTHDSVHALRETVKLVRAKRSGSLTDEEQDLLRAMIVMAASGLDAMTRLAVESALPFLWRHDESILRSFQEYLSRRLKVDGADRTSSDASRLLAELFTAQDLQEAAINEYIASLTGGSLQSTDALYRICDALNITKKIIDKEALKPIFEDRHRIIHVFDVDFAAPKRNRRSRRISDTIAVTNQLLNTAEQIYIACEKRLLTVLNPIPPVPSQESLTILPPGHPPASR